MKALYTFPEFICRQFEAYENEAILSKLEINQNSQVIVDKN